MGTAAEAVDNPSCRRIRRKDSVKGNRQGSLSRWIKQLLKLSEVSKFNNLSKKTFSTG